MFQLINIINKDLTSITMKKDKVLLNLSLNLSKITMYSFHCQQIVAKFGSKALLAYTDTDSLVSVIETKNIYDNMAAKLTLSTLQTTQ